MISCGEAEKPCDWFRQNWTRQGTNIYLYEILTDLAKQSGARLVLGTDNRVTFEQP